MKGNEMLVAMCEEGVLANVSIEDCSCAGEAFEEFEAERSAIVGCSFLECDFARALFVDVAFSSCDFSNSSFAEAQFARCSFVSCKLVGCDFDGATFESTTFSESSASYASFNGCRWFDLTVRSCDLTQARCSHMVQDNLQLGDVRLSGVELYGTSLAGIDFSSCEIEGLLLSDTFSELKGSTMDLYQAAGLARRFGVNVSGA